MHRTFLLLIALACGCATGLAQTSGEMQLTIVQTGDQLKGETKIEIAGQALTTQVRDFKTSGSDIEFTANVLSAELRFRGTFKGDGLSGPVAGSQAGGSAVSGIWVLKRQGPGVASQPYAGTWVGNIALEISAPPPLPPTGADLGFNPTVAAPAYSARHPKVLFDTAHNNKETPGTSYKPFADLMTNDGYQIVPGTTKFTKNSLAGYEVLIIVNAAGPESNRGASPFTEEECDAVRDWVNAGGALLLISDHSPFSSAVAQLAKRFEVTLTVGFTADRSKYNKEAEDQTELLFTRDDGLLADHPITRGRNAAERINRIITFSGTSMKGPTGSVQILKLSDTAIDVLPPPPKVVAPEEALPEHKEVSAAGRAQGVALETGKGRVVVLGEAAMLTAQVGSRGFRFGMNVSGIDNRQLALNIMHWLSGLLK